MSLPGATTGNQQRPADCPVCGGFDDPRCRKHQAQWRKSLALGQLSADQGPRRLDSLRYVVFRAFCLAIIASTFSFAFSFAQTQKRDHLNEQEADLIRDFQEIDKRIEIFVKAADRRLLVLANPNATQKKKEEETWGPLPAGTRLELLQDYKRILEEAEEKLDDWLNRGGKDSLLPKALSKFKEAAARHAAQLRALAPQMTDKREQRALAEAIEEAENVTKASMN